MAHRRPTVTPDDRGPLIEVSVYLLLSNSALATIIKILTKIIIARKLHGDDWFAISSVVCKHLPRVHRACFDTYKLLAVGQYVARLQQVHGGLGQHFYSRTAEEVSVYEKVD